MRRIWLHLTEAAIQVPTPRAWIERVHQPETEAELEALRRSVARSQPFGSAAWLEGTAERLGL